MPDYAPVNGEEPALPVRAESMTAGQQRLFDRNFGPSGLSTFLTDLQANPAVEAARNQNLGSYLLNEGEKLWDAMPKTWDNPDPTLAVLDTLALPAEALVGMGKGIGSIIKEAVTDPTPETAADAALAVAGLGGGLSALGVGAKQARSLGMFVGRNAENADLSKLATAEKMALKGHSREEIYDQTGWFKWERDGKPISDWRSEMSDLGSLVVHNPKVLTPKGQINKASGGSKAYISLRDVFEHPELAKAYTGRPPGAVSNLSEPALGGRALSDKEIHRQRLLLSGELKALKKSGLDTKEYDTAYQKLQDRDTALLDAYRELKADDAGIPMKETELKPVEWGPNTDSRLKSPILDIPMKKMEAEYAKTSSAYYESVSDTMAVGKLPGNAMSKKLDWVPWNEKGEFTQKLDRKALEKNRKAAEKVFKKAGLSLDTVKHVGDPDFHSLRHWKTDRKLSKEEQARVFKTTPEAKEAWDLVHKREATYYKNNFESLVSFRSAVIHELQHGIQHREGWEGGGNRRSFKNVRLKDPDTGKKLSAKEMYMRLLGEIEARLADHRKDFPDAERYSVQKRPWTREGGLDRLESQAILKKDFARGGFVDKPLYDNNSIVGL